MDGISDSDGGVQPTGASKDEARLSCRISLALSGGGFRAALFHLGVIRRLEELGIMKHVHTISGSLAAPSLQPTT